MVRIGLAVICLTVGVALLSACEPYPEISFVNEGSEEITIYLDGTEQLSVAPGDVERLATEENLWPRRLTIRMNADVILDEEFTWDDLEERDFKITIMQ